MPVYVRVVVGRTAISKCFKFALIVHGCQTIILSRLIHGFCIGGGIYELSHLRTEGELMVVANVDRQFLGHATLGLYEYGAIDTFVTIERSGGTIAEYGYRLYFVKGQVVYGTLYTVYQYE